MKKLLKQGNSSGENNPLEIQNSSFGENIASFQKRIVPVEESKTVHQHNNLLFARMGQGDGANRNDGHFGGTRYNQIGAQSMSVASVSLANNGQSIADPLNQG